MAATRDSRLTGSCQTALTLTDDRARDSGVWASLLASLMRRVASGAFNATSIFSR